jgi:hypothetical protein
MMFKKALLALALLVSATGASFAQTSGQAITGFLLNQGSTYNGYTCPSSQPYPCFVQYGATIPVSGTFSATLAGFTPTAGATANVSDVVNTSQDIALPAGTDVIVTNKGSVDVNFRIQTGAGTAVSTDQTLKAGAAIGIHVGSATHLSVIAPTGTGTGSTAGQVNIQGGSGLAAGYGGSSSSGGSGGVVTQPTASQLNATVVGTGTFATQLTGSTNNINNISGIVSLPTGASTAANQATGNTSLATIATNTTGVATAANQATGNTSAATTATNTTAMSSVLGTTTDNPSTGCPNSTGAGTIMACNKALVAAAQAGTANTGSSVPASAILIGCRAATSAPTAVTDGQLVAPQCNPYGKIVVDPFASSSFRVSGKATSTDTSAHTLIAAGTGSLKNYITDIQCSRNDGGTTPITLTFSDTASSTMMIPNAGNGGINNFHTNSPFVTAAATAFTFTSGTGTTTVSCNAQGYQAP